MPPSRPSAAELLRQTAELLQLAPEQLSDAELVKLIRKNHRRADLFALLLERYEGRLLRFLAALLPRREDAEDAYQETCLRLYRHLDRYDARWHFSTWAYTIARRVALSRRRWLGRRSPRERPAPSQWSAEDARSAELPDRGRSPAEHVADREFARAVEEALRALPVAQREVFHLYQFEHLPYEKIARIIRRPLGTVKSRMNAALTHLRRLLKAHDPDRGAGC